MITLKNVDKYFNRHKKNEVHVINDISLDMNSGLVAILGPSGCGKTTLLNVIGGLDKIKKGSIYIDDKKISSKSSYKVDKIRNLNVGYIFQDYKLIENLSVYDNLSLVLKMIGIKDKKEISKRIEYVLEKVGMLRYKRRPAGMLSGGEKQRVGVARALVKNPDIILADEPTGNLDSKNSLEIMKIIKAISNEKLVILVTHEQDLAKFYASRIIELQDGVIIKDYKNDTNDSLDYRVDNSFYLKDFKYNNSLKESNINIDVYSETKDSIKLDIVIKNGNIYIKSKNDEKIEVVDNNSSIEFINDNYKKIEKSEVENLKFDYENISNKDKKLKYSSVLNLFTLISKGFKNVFDYPILKKILLLGFFVSGLFIMYSVAFVSSTFDIRDEDFTSMNKNYLVLKQNKINVSDYISYEKKDNIDYIMPGNSNATFNIKINDYLQTKDIDHTLNGSLSSVDMISSKDLIKGRMPENTYEIVVDKMTLNKMLEVNEGFKMSGVFSYEDFIDREVDGGVSKLLKIVGITDLKDPSIYVSKDLLIDILYNTSEHEKQVYDYEINKEYLTLKKGSWPTKDYEVIVNIDNKDYMPLNKTIDVKINGKKLKVVGYYTSSKDINLLFVNNNTVKYDLILNSKDITIYSKDSNKTVEEFRKENLNILKSYDYSKNNYIKENAKSNRTTIIVSSIMILISLIEMFLMSRSSFLSRIKEIGIYRAIGVKKSDIYKMFYGEILAINIIATLPGVLFMTYVLKVITGIKYMSRMFVVTPITVLISIIIIFIFNSLVGLLPVFNVLRKTPAQILSRYDLE